MIAWLLVQLASAGCTDLAGHVAEAQALYDDAELEDAKTRIADAYESLGCQGRVITSDELLSLFRLDGLVSLSLEDPKGATYATIRAVAVDHQSGEPSERYGPLLADLYQTWVDRLADSTVYVRVSGGGTAWVDGRPVDGTGLLVVAAGEHLIQVDAGGTLRSELVDLQEDHLVNTGVPGPGPVPLPAAETPPAPIVVSPPAPTSAPVVEATVAPAVAIPTRKHPAGWFIGGLVAGGAGAASIWYASEREAVFLGTVYDADVYRGCSKENTCYGDARLQQIRSDANIVNALYGVGYGLSALGGGLIIAGSVGVQASPQGVALHGRF